VPIFKRVAADENAATAVENGRIASLIAVVTITAMVHPLASSKAPSRT